MRRKEGKISFTLQESTIEQQSLLKVFLILPLKINCEMGNKVSISAEAQLQFPITFMKACDIKQAYDGSFTHFSGFYVGAINRLNVRAFGKAVKGREDKTM